jgi:predicted phosphodiesterase
MCIFIGIFVLIIAPLIAAKNCSAYQIHMAQGPTPTSMTISWLTFDHCSSVVSYGRNSQLLDKYSYGTSEAYDFIYDEKFYESNYIHHTLIPELEPSTQYFYICGSNTSYPLNFTTLPGVGDPNPLIFGIIGDLGQTDDSLITVNHLSNDKTIQMILHAGDLSYADCKAALWDSYGEMIEPLAKQIPWMVCAGNHEIEFNGSDYSGLYTAFEKRYRMPVVAGAEFGDVLIPSTINSDTGMPRCTPSVFQSEYNYGNSFYSFDAGIAHIIYLNPYSNTSTTSLQYKWLQADLESVNRTLTPWIIVVLHCPWYSSNKNHYGDTQTVLMRDSMEYLFYMYNVNIVFSGHVHAYERTYPVYRNSTNGYGTVYITIGDGGNLEGHDNEYYDQPAWSAFRNGKQYGHGILTLFDKNELQWRWYRNKDEMLIFDDDVSLSNSIFGEVEYY